MADVNSNILYVEPDYSNAQVAEANGDDQKLYEFTNEYDDYCVVVDLMVEVPGRTHTIEKTEGKKVYVMSFTTKGEGEQNSISFMEGTKIKYDGSGNFGQTVNSLTTDYTDVYYDNIVNYTTNEMFGIESIDINYDNYMVPTVTIEFTDLRGISLFCPEELRHTKTENGIDALADSDVAGSFFKSFFMFPYPKFSLLVKGYYGQPVTYELSCTDFRAHLDSKNGNYGATCSFVGYAYSLLNDITMNALSVAPLCDYNGSSYWESHKTQSEYALTGDTSVPLNISEILYSLKNVQSNLQKLSASDTTVQQASDLDNQLTDMDNLDGNVKQNFGNLLVGMRNLIPDKGVIIEDDDTKISNLNNFFKVRNSSYAIYLSKNLSNLVDKNISLLNKFISDGNIAIKEFNSKYGAKLPYIKFSNGVSINYDDSNSNVYKSSKCSYGLGESSNVSEYEGYAFTGYNFKESFDKSYEELKKGKQNADNGVNEKTNQAVIQGIGFDPCVYNLTKILMFHMETLLYMIYQCAQNIGDKRKISGLSPNDLKETEYVPPFPRVTKIITENNVSKEVDAWIGDFGANIEEAMLIDSLLEATKKMQKAVASAESTLEQMQNSGNTEDQQASYKIKVPYPISPCDVYITGNPFGNGGLKTNDIGNIANRIFARYSMVCATNFAGNMKAYGTHPEYHFMKAGVADANNLIEAFKYDSIDDFLTYISKKKSSEATEELLEKSKMYQEASKRLLYLYYNNCLATPIQDFWNGNMLMKKMDVKNTFFTTNKDNVRGFKHIDIELDSNRAIQITKSLDDIFGGGENGGFSAVGGFYEVSKASDYGKFYKTTSAIENGYFNVKDKNGTDIFESIGGNTSSVSSVNFSDFVLKRTRTNPISSSYTDQYGKHKTDGDYYLQLFNVITSIMLGCIDKDRIRKISFGKISTDPDNNIIKIGGFVAPKVVVLYLCGLCYLIANRNKYGFSESSIKKEYIYKIMNPTGTDLFVDNYIESSIGYHYDDGDKFYEDNNIIKEMSNQFKEWANSQEAKEVLNENNAKAQSDNGDKELNQPTSKKIAIYPAFMMRTCNYDLINDFKSTSWVKYYKTYLYSMIDTLISAKDENDKENQKSEQEAASKNGTSVWQLQEDIRISLYKYIKNLYDRWLSGTSLSKWSIPEIFDKHFHFIDSYYNKIGNVADINIQSFCKDIIEIQSQGGYTFLSFLGNMYTTNNFMFNCLQNFLDWTDESKFKSIFTPIAFIDMEKADYQSDFVVIYTYEASNKLDFGESEYKSDSFMLNGDSTQLPIAITNKTESIGYKVPAFGVSYGAQYQSYFQNISVGMENPINTEQSLKAQFMLTDAAAGQTGEGLKSVASMGQDLYTIYANNSYECTVEMMGCAYIQPLMYFVLLNVPLFKGSYLIQKVSHSIKPGSMTTKFIGTRMAKTANPLLKEALVGGGGDTEFGDENYVKLMEAKKADISNDCKYMYYEPILGGGSLLSSSFIERNKEVLTKILLGESGNDKVMNKLEAVIIYNHIVTNNMNVRPKGYSKTPYLTRGVFDPAPGEFSTVKHPLSDFEPSRGKASVAWENSKDIFYKGPQTAVGIKTSDGHSVTVEDCQTMFYTLSNADKNQSQMYKYGNKMFMHKFGPSTTTYIDNRPNNLKDGPTMCWKYVKPTGLKEKDYADALFSSIEQTAKDSESLSFAIERKDVSKYIQIRPKNSADVKKMASLFDAILNTYYDQFDELWWAYSKNPNEQYPSAIAISPKTGKTKTHSIFMSNSQWKKIQSSYTQYPENIFKTIVKKYMKDKNLEKYAFNECKMFVSSEKNEITKKLEQVKIDTCPIYGGGTVKNYNVMLLGDFVKNWGGGKSEGGKTIHKLNQSSQGLCCAAAKIALRMALGDPKFGAGCTYGEKLIPKLKQKGFMEAPYTSETFSKCKIGDVIIVLPSVGHEWGHTEYCYGTSGGKTLWASDFIQNDSTPYSTVPLSYYRIFYC